MGPGMLTLTSSDNTYGGTYRFFSKILAHFGVLFVTRQNVSAPWLLFEAGALSKTVSRAFV
jgi:cystathionine beta-lyase/cystathionine gamma-synthase